ncbi:MAG: DUF3883 domain-containing protein [Deltaproteobacteria bacterium]|nr:DUF3883 domain-containing protein [Deltaproteobacteria bacterium]
MAHLEDLKEGASIKGIRPDGPVTIINVKWHGDSVVELTYKDSSGRPGNELLFRDREPIIEVIEPAQSWSFDADAGILRLVSEAYRIRMAYLFDPLLAVHTSLIDPLPHQITAVYEEMIPRQPLRYLLADDPGAGKTIMAGLLIKELMVRGDLDRCMIVCPGNLVDQWQDELYRRLHLPFEILTNDRLEAARTGNAFQEIPLLIARLDKLSRNEDVQIKLKQTDWDLIICDEAHKMSASFFSGEIKETKRRKLGRLLSELTRHFLLMTATPHNGKEEDFQLFMALLDGDRFEGRFRDGVHMTEVSDLMRRMVKEELVKFDGTPLFPERLAYTVTYRLSDKEAILYEQVTNYVREEFNRADALESEGRKGTVGFALTILQRRLASSPEAIYQSLRRRRERLESRLREEELLKRGAESREKIEKKVLIITEEDIEDLEDATDAEVEETEEQIVDLSTAAQTIAELQAEISTLKKLEAFALEVRRSGQDKKWEELSKLLQENCKMFDAEGTRHKLVIFTEHRDTLSYLTDRIRTLMGRPDTVINIHGSMGREDRKKAEESFKQDKNVQILVATDAAGEGINLQRAHLMVNYDLPWNPNRIEQRFGRIHRIGQTEVCHLWNMVAEETREGDIYLTLRRKLEAEREALGGSVFDVLGKALGSAELRRLLIEAIRYGDRPEVRARLTQHVEQALDTECLKGLIEEKGLVRDSMDSSRIRKIREDMERAEARRLQPHFIASFFLEAFKLLGGSAQEREPKRYEIKHVPAVIRNRDRLIGLGEPVLTRYERICFEKDLISIPGKPLATFVCPGPPLLDATTDIILERYRNLLRQSAVFLNESDPALTEEERSLITPSLKQKWLHNDLESRATGYAITHLVPRHFKEVKDRKGELITKAIAAVKERLTKEIAYWDHRAEELKAQELAGKINARINSAKARARADELQARLQNRLEELEKEKQLSPLPPVVMGGALIVPGGLLARLRGKRDDVPDLFARETKRIEQMAMQAVMDVERSVSYIPRDVSRDNCGYDIESAIPASGKLRFIEVKGRLRGAKTVTVTKNEILTALNKPDDFILAIVLVPPSDKSPSADPWQIGDPAGKYGTTRDGCRVYYVRRPFTKEPDFGVTSVNYNLADLIGRVEVPR